MRTIEIIGKTLVLLSLVFVVSCSDYDRFEPYNSGEDRFTYLNEIKPESTVATLNTDASHALITADSILLEIPANSFVDNYGQQYLGKVNMAFSVLDQKKHLLASKLSLINNDGDLFESLAAFKIDAFAESGHVLKLAPGKSLKIKYPGLGGIDMPAIYSGIKLPEEGDQVNWKEINQGHFINKLYHEGWTWKSVDGEIRHSSGLILQTDLMDWVVLGYKVDQFQQKNVEIIMPESFDGENTMVFLSGSDSNNIQILKWDEERHKFCNTSGKIPDSGSIELISISSSEEGRVYISKETINEVQDGEFLLEPVSYTVEEAIEILNSI